MHVSRIDTFVLVTILSTAWFMWRFIDMVTLGAGFALIGSQSVLGWITIGLLVVATYCIASLLFEGMQYVRLVLSGSTDPDTALADHLPKLLVLAVVYGAALVVQTVWYMHNGY